MEEQILGDEWIAGTKELTNEELDAKLEEMVVQNDESEKLICAYLFEMRERGAYREFGYDRVYDYAAERFGFSTRKTRYLLSLGGKIRELPKLRAALQKGKIGWVKASRVASVATEQNEAMWLDSALSLSVKELDSRIKDGTDRLASAMSFWMTDDQRIVWENALEICRRVAGAELSPGEALEYVAGEFMATYAHLFSEESELGYESDDSVPPQGAVDDEHDGEGEQEAQHCIDEQAIAAAKEKICPSEEGELPSSVIAFPYDRTWSQVLERDNYQCRYPGCTGRKQLHVHHVVFRSHFGNKREIDKHHPSNLVTVCAFHHRMIHAAAIGVSGRAPHELDWRPPKLMRAVLQRRRNRPARFVSELEVYSAPGTRWEPSAATA
jgi:5-methylcytosine-specific restriction endonuclease McrA